MKHRTRAVTETIASTDKRAEQVDSCGLSCVMEEDGVGVGWRNSGRESRSRRRILRGKKKVEKEEEETEQENGKKKDRKKKCRGGNGGGRKTERKNSE